MKVKEMRLKKVEEFSCNHEKHMISEALDIAPPAISAICLQCKTWVEVLLVEEE